MLRAGYSSESVLREISSRRLLDTIDPAMEKMLAQAGATPELINAIKSGAYTAAHEESAKVNAEMEAQARRRASQAEEAC